MRFNGSFGCSIARFACRWRAQEGNNSRRGCLFCSNFVTKLFWFSFPKATNLERKKTFSYSFKIGRPAIETEKVGSSDFRTNYLQKKLFVPNRGTFSHFMEIGRWHARQGHLLAEDVPRVIFLSKSLYFQRRLCYNSLTSMTQKKEVLD